MSVGSIKHRWKLIHKIFRENRMKEIKVEHKQSIKSLIEEYPILKSCTTNYRFSSKKINDILGYDFIDKYQVFASSNLIKSILEEFQKNGLDITKEIEVK